MSQSLASVHFQAMEELTEGGDSLLSETKVTDWASQNKVLEFEQDTEKMAISPPHPGTPMSYRRDPGGSVPQGSGR